MLTCRVVLYKPPGMSSEEFRRHLTEVHGPLAHRLPAKVCTESDSGLWEAEFSRGNAVIEVLLTCTPWYVVDEIMVLE